MFSFIAAEKANYPVDVLLEGAREGIAGGLDALDAVRDLSRSLVILLFRIRGIKISEWGSARLVFSEAGLRVLDSMFPELARPPGLTSQREIDRAEKRLARRQTAVQSELQGSREVLKTRLLDLSAPLHSEVDRPDAEATFRMALWPPLAGLAVYLSVTHSPWWMAALVLPLLVAWQWISLRRRANDALVTAIAAQEELRKPFVTAVKARMAGNGAATEEKAPLVREVTPPPPRPEGQPRETGLP